MWFADENGGPYGESITYKELGKMLNKIECNKMLVAYFSCVGNTGLSY